MIPDPDVGDLVRVRVHTHHREYTTYPPVPAIVVYVSRFGARAQQPRFSCKLLERAAPGWNPGDTYRAHAGQLYV